MNIKKPTKKELQERETIEDKKFNRTMLKSSSILFVLMVLFSVFYTYWCETKYTYRQYTLYGEEIPPELLCMNGDNILIHESLKANYKGKTYYFCSQYCYSNLVDHFQKVAFIPDSFSGDTICKADALIGLKNRGKSEVVYFKNKVTFNRYYKVRN